MLEGRPGDYDELDAAMLRQRFFRRLEQGHVLEAIRQRLKVVAEDMAHVA